MVSSKQGKSVSETILILTTILMGLASIATAFCGYQASFWGGDAAAISLRMNSLHSKSAELALTANQLTIIDVQLFTQWLDAFSSGNKQQAEYYLARFRTEAKPAFEKWLAQDPFNNPKAPASPFIMEEYVLQKQLDAARLERDADELSNQALLARQKSTDYAVNTILLASASLFAGLATRSTSLRIETMLAGLSGLTFAWALFRIIILVTGG
jgi:hypothetical protein